jgi:hypothetical protein
VRYEIRIDRSAFIANLFAAPIAKQHEIFVSAFQGGVFKAPGGESLSDFGVRRFLIGVAAKLSMQNNRC